jgi:hypothetical protein
MEKMFENYPNLKTKNNKVLENEKKGKRKTFKSFLLKKLYVNENCIT